MQIEQNKFKDWIETNYTNPNTQRQYILAEKRFMEYIENNELNQASINKYLLFARRMQNPFYMGFIQAYIECYDANGQYLKIPKDRSRMLNKKAKPIKFIEKEVLDNKLKILKRHNEQVYVMANLYFETGLRASELINLNASKKQKVWGWNIEERYIWGLGKGNKQFMVHFSKKTAKLFSEWLFKCKNPETPFVFYKSDGTIYKNSYDKLIRTLKKYCGITPHQIRHSLGHYLRVDKGWDLEQIREKLRHSKIETTRIYTIATAQEIAKKEDEEIFKDSQPIPKEDNNSNDSNNDHY